MVLLGLNEGLSISECLALGSIGAAASSIVSMMTELSAYLVTMRRLFDAIIRFLDGFEKFHNVADGLSEEFISKVAKKMGDNINVQ